MKRLFFLLTLTVSVSVSAQRYETVPFGDFEQWTTRYIKESAVLGGKTRTVYALAPTGTVSGNKAFDYSSTIWGGSNVYANVMGVATGSCAVTPEKGPSGLCARLETGFVEVKAVGIVNVKVLAQGSLFWGKVHEPVNSTKNPYASQQWGIPFTKRPDAVVVDYKALIPNTGEIVKNNETVKGYDAAEIMLVLQNRWEDANGNIHAQRVGTAYLHIGKSTSGWVKNARIPVIYGDARSSKSYRSYMNIMGARLYSVNSKGVKKQIIEEGWADSSTPVTHAIMSVSSGSLGAFVGAVGNTLWVDNLRLEYGK